jgi:hypothetical protein
MAGRDRRNGVRGGANFALAAIGRSRGNGGAHMNTVASTAHSLVYHVAMITSVCVAGLSFLVLVVLMIVAENARLKHGVAHPRVWSLLKVVFVLATVIGLLASLPFALASGAHSVAAILMWEVVYASVIALGSLAFAAMMAHVVTAEIEPGEYDPRQTDMFDDDSLFRINPATGLPMNGSLDMGGNPFGWDSHSAMERTFIE